MGEYIGIRIKNYDFIMCKNSFCDLLSIYSKEDIRIGATVEDEEECHKTYSFVTTVERAKLILDSMGFTVENARHNFEDNKQYELEYAQEFEAEVWNHSLGWTYDEVKEGFTFEKWQASVQKFAKLLAEDTFDYTIGNYKKLNQINEEDLSIADKIVLETLPFGEGYFGMRGETSVWTVFRIILDTFEEDEELVLDYTNLFYGGWCNEYPDERDFYAPKTIVLTEGKFDAEAIQKSMGILYPHMLKYYSFMNFSDYKVQGSTNFLTHYLKAFVGAGIQNRIIAIYDNDSAGIAEIISLKSLTIPENFRVMRLPDIELAKCYPTLGPNGNEEMDINGKACSIELFLGKDVLMENDILVPIQWKGYIERTETYQGEVMHKGNIQERFNKKVEITKERGEYELSNWEEMNLLLKNIFYAFLGDYHHI